MASIGDTLAPLTASTVVDPVSQYSYVTALKVAHRCGITLAGQLQCWGSNSYGQIGTGNKEYVSFPAVIDPGVSYKSVAVNEYSTCAVTTSGLMKCWGFNNYGQMGTGSGVHSLKPMVVDEEERYLKVESGNRFVCGLTTSRVMKCTGNLDWKNLSYVFDFTEMDSTFLSDIVVGTHRVCVKVQSNGSFRCWGEGYTASSNWGSPGTVGGSEEPIVLGGGTAYSQVLPGYGLLCAIAGAAGDLFCAGGNWQGEAGLGHTFGVQTLTNVGSDFRQVAGGYYSTCTLKKTGTGRVCWGMNSSGQLGAGNMNTQILAQTTYDSGIYYERLSEDGNCGLSSGWLRCWGIVSGVGELSGVPSPVYP